MNTSITFPSAEPTLRLFKPSTEKSVAALAEERRRLQEDHEQLRQREQNLRDYEARLRTLQAEIEASRPGSGPERTSSSGASLPTGGKRSSQSPFHHDDPALQAAWEKLHRAREILEAEQKNLSEDRIGLDELQTLLKRREEKVVAREARVAEREAALLAAAPVALPVPAEPEPSTASKLTRGPFNMARSVFGPKK